MGPAVLLLLASLSSVVSAQHDHMAMSSGPVVVPDGCITAPTAANCTDYKYPHMMAVGDINSLCTAMHFMAGCSVAKACNTSGAGSGPNGNVTGPGVAKVSSQNPDVCRPFNLVATVCRHDTGMSKMKGCTNFNTMCVQGSNVVQCNLYKGIDTIPTSEDVNTQVRSICEEMSMDGCEECMPSWEAGKKWADCDLLDVYGRLCDAMPEMSQCAIWHSSCTKDPTMWYCHGTKGTPAPADGAGAAATFSQRGPQMKMYFFNEMPFNLLFKTWIPRNSGDLAGAWITIFFMGVLYELLSMLFGKFESGYIRNEYQRLRSGGCMALKRSANESAHDVETGKGKCGGGKGGPLVEGLHQYGAGVTPDEEDMPATGACCSGNTTCDGETAASHDATAAATKPAPCCCGAATTSSCKPKRPLAGAFSPRVLLLDFVRGVARFVLSGMAYLLMLAAMSFHVAIFFAVITGLAVGAMLFGRWRSPFASEGSCGCGAA